MIDAKRLSQFGEVFIKSVRTDTIKHFEAVIAGKMKSSAANEIHQGLAKFSEVELKFVEKLITGVVDETLFKTLFMFEEQKWTIIEKSIITECNDVGLDEVSDGLSGELFGINGWIAKYK